MNLIDKLTIIDAVWMYLGQEGTLSDDERSKDDYYRWDATKEQYVEYIFYTMILNHIDNPRVIKLLEALKFDGEFELTLLENKREYQAKYNDEFLDYRLDLRNHSPMGFGTGGSSYNQLALAILSKATNDKEALRYYEDFRKDIRNLSKYPTKNIVSNKEVSIIKQTDILHWLATQILSNPVKRICKILHVNQKELAEILNVSDVTVNRWSSKSVDVPAQTKRTFDILEENSILKEKVQKVDLLLKTIGELQKTY
jgi:DNA-binding transcriptional regulator YiaG